MPCTNSNCIKSEVESMASSSASTSTCSSTKRKRDTEENAPFDEMAFTTLSAPNDPNFHQFDVFINHRGPDVKSTLASALHQFLQYAGLKAFLDYPVLQPGDSLPITIQQAIRSSQVHIAIFSPRYAQSFWCLTELQLMLRTGAKIVPVFYDVSYKDLRNPEKGVYARDFDMHEGKGRCTTERISQWKKALRKVSYISGIDFHQSNGNLGHVCKNIVDTVLNQVSMARNKFKLQVADHPVGLDEAIQELEAKLSLFLQNNGGNHGKLVGIVGKAGVGKTTLAKEFYNRKYQTFYRSSFIFDVGEEHRNKHMARIQEKLMSDLRIPLSHSPAFFEASNPKEGFGVEMIKSQLERWYSKPLIILDGVDHGDQLEALALNDFLNHGALVLVTCREASILQSVNDENVKIHEMRGLDPKYARQLFCWHAFRRSNPPDGREKLVETVLKVSGGLPLHLKDMGQEIYPMQIDLNAEL